MQYPLTEVITDLYLDYLTPYMVYERQNVGKLALTAALGAMKDEEGDYQKFITTLCAHSVTPLSRILASVPSNDGSRYIWFYDVPLQRMMRQYRAREVWISEREEPWPVSTILTNMLANIANLPQIIHLIDHNVIRAEALPSAELIEG
jgi:hypothetical protein